jgi:type IV pilus assembly protein PilF
MRLARQGIRLGLLALVLGVLSGCQSPGVKDEEGSGTGRLGAVDGQGNASAAIYIELAAEYLRQRNLTAALQNARKAVMVDSKEPAAHNMLGLIHQQLGESALAERHFAEAVRLDPKDPYANNAYGSFLCGQQRYQQAMFYFDAAVANPLNPSPWVPLGNAGLCSYEQGEVDRAERYFRRALQSNPKFAPALLRMASISFQQGNYLSARAYLQRYLGVAPHTAETLWLGIRTERQLGDMDQVASYELLLRSKFPDSEQVRQLQESR